MFLETIAISSLTWNQPGCPSRIALLCDPSISPLPLLDLPLHHHPSLAAGSRERIACFTPICRSESLTSNGTSCLMVASGRTSGEMERKWNPRVPTYSHYVGDEYNEYIPTTCTVKKGRKRRKSASECRERYLLRLIRFQWTNF